MNNWRSKSRNTANWSTDDKSWIYLKYCWWCGERREIFNINKNERGNKAKRKVWVFFHWGENNRKIFTLERFLLFSIFSLFLLMKAKLYIYTFIDNVLTFSSLGWNIGEYCWKRRGKKRWKAFTTFKILLRVAKKLGV